MTTEAVAQVLDASPVGHGRWVARCPAHDDSAPSLSIRQGAEGRTLVHCFAGCGLDVILGTSGLRMADLFSGPSPSADQMQIVAREREKRRAERGAIRLYRWDLEDKYRRLHRAWEAIIDKLNRTRPEAPEVASLEGRFHELQDTIRNVEAQLEEIEDAYYR